MDFMDSQSRERHKDIAARKRLNTIGESLETSYQGYHFCFEKFENCAVLGVAFCLKKSLFRLWIFQEFRFLQNLVQEIEDFQENK